MYWVGLQDLECWLWDFRSFMWTRGLVFGTWFMDLESEIVDLAFGVLQLLCFRVSFVSNISSRSWMLKLRSEALSWNSESSRLDAYAGLATDC